MIQRLGGISESIFFPTFFCQVPLSIEFSKQECWTGQPFPPPGDFPYPGIKPGSLALKADSLPSEPPGKLHVCIYLWGLCGFFGVCVCVSSLFQKLLEIGTKLKWQLCEVMDMLTNLVAAIISYCLHMLLYTLNIHHFYLLIIPQ